MLKISHEFLPLHVREWQFDEGYKAGKLVVQNLEVVNDTAERGVKLTSDFSKTTRKEDVLQNHLQVIENTRKLVLNQRTPNNVKGKLQGRVTCIVDL